jgi:hypothetical protein
MPKPQGVCIFCGGTGLTKEHVIADWTAKYLHKNIRDHGKWSIRIDEPGDSARIVSNEIKKIDGDPRSRKVRRVCLVCNGGWMRAQQDLAKPIALPMILGSKATLFRREQMTLAIWVLMTVMTSEHSDPEYAAIPQRHRDFLRVFQSPPDNWKIFFARYPKGMTEPYLHHESSEIIFEGIPSDNALNTQATTYSVGHVYVHAVSSTQSLFIDHVRPNLLFGLNRTFQLWPIVEDVLRWPPPLSFTEDDAQAAPGTLYRYGAEVNRRSQGLS